MKICEAYQDNAGFHATADFMASYNRRVRRQRIALVALWLLALASGLIYYALL
jgi:hypothetical protein